MTIVFRLLVSVLAGGATGLLYVGLASLVFEVTTTAAFVAVVTCASAGLAFGLVIGPRRR
jgi:hypothetical protein